MPEVIEPPKKPFSSGLAASLPGSAGQAAPPEPPKPKPADAPPAPPSGKPAPTAALPEDGAKRDSEISSGKAKPVTTDWDRKQLALEAANKRADELKAKLELAEKAMAPKHDFDKTAKELVEAQKERDELKAKWQLVAAQFDSGFHAKYDAKVGEAIAKIKDAVPADRLDKISQLLQMPESEWKRKAMAELTEDMDTPTITDIMLANREVRDILTSRKKELDDSGTILKTSAEQRQKQQEERKSAYAKSFDAVLASKSAGDDAIPVLQTRDGDTPEVKEWNNGVAERSRVSRAIFMDEFDTPEEKAEAAIWAASAPGFLTELKSAQARVAELEGELKRVQGSSPGLGGGGKGEGGGEKKTFSQQMMETAIR